METLMRLHSPNVRAMIFILCYPIIQSSFKQQRMMWYSPDVLTFLPEWYVDVEDVAKLCIIGLLDSDVKSQRIFAFGEQMNWTDTISLLRELRPENNKIPDPPADDVRDSTEVFPRTRSQILLRGFFDQLDFTPIKDSIEKGIEDLP